MSDNKAFVKVRPAIRWLIGVPMLVSLLVTGVVLSRKVPYELKDKDTGAKLEGQKLLKMVAELGDGGEVYASFFDIEPGETVNMTMVYQGHRLNVDAGIHSWRGYMYMAESFFSTRRREVISGGKGWDGPYQRTGNITTQIGSNDAGASAECRAAAHELTGKIHAKLVDTAEVTYRRQYVVYCEKTYVWCYDAWSGAKSGMRGAREYLKEWF